MAENTKRLQNKKYLQEIFRTVREMKGIEIVHLKGKFNSTEMRFIGEILEAEYEGKRLISTQLAKRLGITRSAISQIANKLEAQGVIVRVADEINAKIAYIQLSENAMKTYESELEYCLNFVQALVEKFGVKKLETLCSLSKEFVGLVETVKEEKSAR
ncbi:MAG: MarR family transcriptional regulator [Clostridia bacterium]|nr:MarR family transcriptional regulator [Clostridia bacterium]